MRFGMNNVDWQQRIDFDRLRKERVARANQMLHKYGIGSAIIYNWDSQRYVSSLWNHPYSRHVPSHFVLLIRDAGFPYVHAMKEMDELRLPEDCPWLEGRIVTDDELSQPPIMRMWPIAEAEKRWARSAQQIKSLLCQHGVADLPCSIDYGGLLMIKALQDEKIKVVDGNSWMQEARMVKMDQEIELLEMAASCNEAGYSALAQELRVGMTENDARGIMSKAIYEAGAEYIEGWVTNAGPRAAPRSYNWSDRIIRPGELFTIEACHVTFCGYKVCYDRTFMVGDRPTDLQREIYQVAVDMHYKARENFRPGLTTHDIARLRPFPKPVFKSVEQARTFRTGWGNHFGGMGMGHNEAPYCTLDEPPITLEKNMVFAYHVTLWGERDGVAIENTYWLTDTGCENFCKWPFDEPTMVGPSQYSWR